jgi:hypothetical protein
MVVLVKLHDNPRWSRKSPDLAAEFDREFCEDDERPLSRFGFTGKGRRFSFDVSFGWIDGRGYCCSEGDLFIFTWELISAETIRVRRN